MTRIETLEQDLRIALNHGNADAYNLFNALLRLEALEQNAKGEA